MKNNNDASATTHIGPLGGDSDGDAAQHTAAESNSLGHGKEIRSNGPTPTIGHSKVAHRSDAKTKSCKVCRIDFTPAKPLQTVCSPACALTLASSKRAKAIKVAQVKERKADAVKRDSLKSRSQWMKEAQTAFNQFIRLRDAGKPCICCGRHSSGMVHGGDFDAGHYRSRGSAPHLKYDERNVHAQLKQCNRYDSGNVVGYRLGLIERIGLDAVEALESDQEPRKYSIDDLKAIKITYAAKARELRA